MMMPSSRGPGFFGKLIHHADFVGRRLPPSFVARWDDWLQDCLEYARCHLGPAWMDIYLQSPMWRFLLVEESACWAGVCMPSVDSVGRQFPLTIAMSMPPNSDLQAFIGQSEAWFSNLEALALSTLHPHFELANFEASLQTMKLDVPRASHLSAVHLIEIASLSAVQAQLPSVTSDLLYVALVGKSVWWTAGSAQCKPTMIRCSGLPKPRLYCAMLSGQFERNTDD